MDTMKKIDGHFHVNFCGFSAKKIIEYLDKNKIEKCWLLSWEENNPPIPNLYEHLSIESIIDAYEKYPNRIVPFYAPDPGSENIKETLEKYMGLGIKGCGELKVTYKWEDPLMEKYVKIVSELGLPLLFHMEAPREHYVKVSNSKMENLLEQLFNGALNGLTKYYLTKVSKIAPFVLKKISKGQKYFPGYLYDFVALEKMVKKYPNVIFVGHGPHFWNNIGKHQSEKYTHQRGKINEWGIIDNLLTENDNFYCDISGKSGFNALTRDKKRAKLFLEKHHLKLIFGTDNTNYDFDEMLNSYKLSRVKLESIYYKNAEKIIN